MYPNGNSKWHAARFGLLRRVAASVAFVALAAGLAGPAAGQVPGRFEVRSASTELVSGVYFLTAWIEYRLSSEARQALESGVPLTIRIEVELLTNRRFWLDTQAASLTQVYQLEYHALSERYIVRNLNSGEQISFATLFSALNHLGRVEELPLIDAALLEPGAEYDVRIRAALDTEDFPGPLRLLTFWRQDFALRSEWYRWQLGSD